MMHVKRTNPMGKLHVATRTYVESQVRALCHVRRTSCMGTQYEQSSCQKEYFTEHMCNKDTCNKYRGKTQRVLKAW